MNTLYIVSTPIGNLQDLTIRAAKILFEVKLIACEDTRRTGLLIQYISEHFNAGYLQKPKLLSYYEENEKERIPEIITYLKEGSDVALVSDAGTPAISDPGFKLIRECVREGLPVSAVPGPSSVLAALVVSGLPTDKFTFLGYLPHKESHAKLLLQNIIESRKIVKTTVIIFEAPHKLLRTLQTMHDIFGDIEIVICREMTKVHEEILRMTISKAIVHFSEKTPKGEVVIVF